MLNVAIVGCGYFGELQLEAWHRIENINLIKVLEKSEARAVDLKGKYPELVVIDNNKDLFEGKAPDIIDVATPPHTHAEVIRPLLGRVKTIICQKPFCRNLEEAEALVRDAEASSTTLIIHENFRFMPWYRTIKTLIAKEHLGSVRQATFRLRPGDGMGDDAYLSRQPYFRDMEKFLIRETGIHWIDTFRFLFGEPQSVFADLWKENPVIKGEDSGIVIFQFADEMRAVFDANRTIDHAAKNPRLTMGEFTVEGTNGGFFLNGDGQLFHRKRNELEAKKIQYDFNSDKFGGDCIRLFQQHVIDHLLNGKPLETEARDYLKNLKIEEKIYQSFQDRLPTDV